MIIMMRAEDTLVVADPTPRRDKSKIQGHRVLQKSPTAVNA